jgi:hypothetical protein
VHRVSIGTMRQAYAAPQDAGLIVVKHGKGWPLPPAGEEEAVCLNLSKNLRNPLAEALTGEGRGRGPVHDHLGPAHRMGLGAGDELAEWCRHELRGASDSAEGLRLADRDSLDTGQAVPAALFQDRQQPPGDRRRLDRGRVQQIDE